MKLVWLIARKYFFSRKNPSAVNIITGISLAGYAVGAMALLILLSALNGFEDSIFGGYKNSSPHLKMVPNSGKVFHVRKSMLDSIRQVEGVKSISVILQDKAIVKYGDQQTVARVRGVDAEFFKVFRVDSMVKAGFPKLVSVSGDVHYAWLSEGLVYRLGLNGNDNFVELLSPDRTSSSVAQTQLNQEVLGVTAMVQLADDDAQNTVIVPLGTAQMLFAREDDEAGYASEVAIRINGGFGAETGVQTRLLEMFSTDFDVRNLQEQHPTLHKMFNTEKWFSFALLAFILALISFNLFGSLRMMAIDKQSDLSILMAMGMRLRLLRRVFLLEGLLVSTLGSILGMVVAVILILLQQTYGWVKTQSTFEMVYPVSLRWGDMVLVLSLNALLGILVSLGVRGLVKMRG
jgi:lipoprotein-releasing system permease protein